MHSQNCMPWERCFRRATDGIKQEHYVSVNSKSVVSYGPYSQRHVKTTAELLVFCWLTE